ncbi:unnamed protein product [Callosobruchus maculatus]|uniref:Ig-like domain-containing protein n=1 Tax=Callosobruchus maculatus TaxID=64391 RepID=A0A653DHX3_CALMS|nr:unnamed protein product [Callosobruchus maculatus]
MCKADGFPMPKIIWRREDGQAISIERQKKVSVYTQERLSIIRITRSEMGAYLCIATNGVPPSVSKRIIVDVECKPRNGYHYIFNTYDTELEHTRLNWYILYFW